MSFPTDDIREIEKRLDLIERALLELASVIERAEFRLETTVRWDPETAIAQLRDEWGAGK